MSDEPAPPGRLRPRVMVAVVVAAVMVVGIAGAVAYAVWGGSDEPTGRGLEPAVNAEEPAVADESAAPQEPVGAAAPAPPDGASPDATSPDASGAGGTGPGSSVPAAAGDDVEPGVAPSSDSGAASEAGQEPGPAAIPIPSIEPLPEDADLPTPGSDPVELPALLPLPGPVTTSAGTALAELDPDAVEGLDGWDVVSRRDDYLELNNGSQVMEVFAVGPSPDASSALAAFFDDLADDMTQLESSVPTLLAAPDSRWMSVVGSEFTATRAGQQGTTALSGSAIAGVDTDGNAVVITTSREGASTADQRAADGVLLTAVLAAVAAG